jgi:WD40 repeat protein
VAYSPDGKYLAAGTADGTVYLWPASRSDVVPRVYHLSRGGAVHSVAFTGNGRYLAAGGIDGRVYLWSTTGSYSHPLGSGNGHGAASVVSIAFSPVGSRLAAGDSAGRIAIWDTSWLRS